MFVVFLKFGQERAKAREFMDGHKRWIEQGFDDGVFLMTGSLGDGVGGALLAAGTTLEALHARVAEDPFVQQGVVQAEVHAITPGRTVPELARFTSQ